MKPSILDDVLKELKRARKKHPSWPDHPAAQAGIVVEEAGELMKASLQWKYEREKSPEDQLQQWDAMYREGVQTAAMALRFLENLLLCQKQSSLPQQSNLSGPTAVK